MEEIQFVYIIYLNSRCGDHILGVYSTEEKANVALVIFNKSNLSGASTYDIYIIKKVLQ